MDPQFLSTNSAPSPVSKWYTSTIIAQDSIEESQSPSFSDVDKKMSALSLIEDTMDGVNRTKDEPKIRNEMIKLLELCLRARDTKCDMRPDHSDQTIHRIAVNLEKRLHMSAVSFKSYSDVETLESRMKVVLFNWKHQRSERKLRRGSLTKMKRRLFLKEQLGPSQYDLAFWLVNEIKQRRTSLVSENCGKCQIANPDMPTTATFGEQLPLPVRNLYFSTPLVDVFEKYSLERIQNHGHHYLEELVTQARTNLQEYDDWKLINSVCPIS